MPTGQLPFAQLAIELCVHLRTLRAAARSGHPQVQFSTRSACGHPVRSATRAAGQEFLSTVYRRRVDRSMRIVALDPAPRDYARQLKQLRRRLHLTQAQLATAIGVVSKAVVYQRESDNDRSSVTPAPTAL